ncbi:MAG: sarcosine oxidase subunit alpha family protein [Pseudomonadota bacterium]
MSTQPYRLKKGGVIDRSRAVPFWFDGEECVGHPGDTLASALLANGHLLVGRSFKFHRPRGIMTAGAAEPNALLTVGEGARATPNTPATMVPLTPGLVARSQNRWPSLKYDAMAVNGLAKPFLGAGFYYKTFMGPFQKSWMAYEPVIRRAAGLGEAPRARDPDRYDRAHLHCDVLVVGGGATGLSAALTAGRMGARVVLAEQMLETGGMLGDEPSVGPSATWLRSVSAELDALANVTVLTRTTVFGAYDDGVFGLLQQLEETPDAPRQRYIKLFARRAVLATGALERPIAFGNNDRPGVMLVSAARRYLNRYGVLPGQRIVAFCNNDLSYEAAFDLADAGARVTVIDPRAQPSARLATKLAQSSVQALSGHVIITVRGQLAVRDCVVARYDEASGQADPDWQRLRADLVLVSGGYDPQVHLASQRGVKPVWDRKRACFTPGKAPRGQHHAGALNGLASTIDCVRQGLGAGEAAARAAGYDGAAGSVSLPEELTAPRDWGAPSPLFDVKPPEGWPGHKRFVDFQNDVSTSDLAIAHREGFHAVEHMKRYTTLGMATDQGKTANVIAIAEMAQLRGIPLQQQGTTTFRPPYTGVTIGAIAGANRGAHARPERRTPFHAAHEEAGAVMLEAGLWKRPWYYPRAGEDLEAAYVREASAVRAGVGLVDISTLGKIDVQGPDAGLFLDRVYANTFSTLKVGKARYGLMLRDDGFVLDDGTTSRLSETQFFMTTTTGEAAPVMAHLEWLLASVWPTLRVSVTSITDQWAGLALAGPRAQELLASIVEGGDCSGAGLPLMGLIHATIAGRPVRIMRLSFSGERAYEVYVPSGFAKDVWRAVKDAGQAFDLTLYGLEAMGALRIEKGHVAAPEIDGRTTLDDLGLGGMASRKKAYVGQVMQQRSGLRDADRAQLVGLRPVDRAGRLRAGALLYEDGAPLEGHGIGHVTSVTYSPQLGHDIALAFVNAGRTRHGAVLMAAFALAGEKLRVEVVPPCFVDPEGSRMKDPEGSRMKDPEGSRMRDPEGSRMKDPEGSRMRDPEGSRMRDPEGSRMRDPEGLRAAQPGTRNDHTAVAPHG